MKRMKVIGPWWGFLIIPSHPTKIDQNVNFLSNPHPLIYPLDKSFVQWITQLVSVITYPLDSDLSAAHVLSNV